MNILAALVLSIIETCSFISLVIFITLAICSREEKTEWVEYLLQALGMEKRFEARKLMEEKILKRIFLFGELTCLLTMDAFKGWPNLIQFILLTLGFILYMELMIKSRPRK